MALLAEIIERSTQSYGKLVLGGIAIFNTMGVSQRAAAAEALHTAHWEKGAVVFAEGEV